MWVTLPPEPGEEVICVKVGAPAIPDTDLAVGGGLLVLTDRRLYHGPLTARLSGMSPARAVGPVTPALTDWMTRARAVDLRQIRSVVAVRDCSLRVTTDDGDSREFVIGASASSPTWSRRNGVHRDELFKAVRKALSRLSG